jgi:glycosyltransferase involved in cell wall biosynthesis
VTVDVSVLTPVLNEERHIAAAVETMRRQRLDGELELLFADGGSTDATRAILEELARDDDRIRVLDNPARQTAAGLNVALRAARGTYVARMDAHTLYPPDYLALGVERLRRGDGVVWASGPQVPYGVDTVSRAAAAALGSWLGTGGAGFRRRRDEEFDSPTGFTGVFDRAFVERVGGWDEGWPVNQDTELGARVLAAGGRIVVLPAMAARYIPRSSVRALARQYARYGFYRAKTSRVHPESMRVSHLLPPAIVVTAAAALAGPSVVRGPARIGAAAYGVAVAAAAASSARERRDEALLVPPVLAAMHLAWGAGFLAGCCRFGPPVGAVRRLARGR